MSVTSRPMPDAKPKTIKDRGCALLVGRAGMWMAVVAFGGVFWAINGGYSVIGLGVMASSFNDAGRFFWAAISSLQFPVPVKVPGLPTTQPLIPWIGVAASSLLQISVAWLRLSKEPIPLTLLLIATLASLYDFVTTLFGLGTVSWVAVIGLPLQIIIAVPLTFALEIAIGYALRSR